jgi:hypothetical protein
MGTAGTTKQIVPDEWKTFFDNFTRAHLRDSIPETVTAEVLSPLLGDQTAISNARLLGLTFDPKSKAFEVVVLSLPDRQAIVEILRDTKKDLPSYFQPVTRQRLELFISIDLLAERRLEPMPVAVGIPIRHSRTTS